MVNVVRVDRTGEYFADILALLGISEDEHARRSRQYRGALGMRESDEYSLIRYVQDEEGCIVLVALDGDKVVGCLKGRIRNAGRHMSFREYAHLSSVCVLPEHRKKQVAKKLVNAFKAWARKKGMSHCMLYVQNNNEGAIKAWSRMGFTTNLRRMHCKLETFLLSRRAD